MRARTRDGLNLSKEEKAIVEKYVSLLDVVAGPISVWATNDEGLLHLYTLVSPEDEAETAVYRAERKLLRAIDPILVDFDVHRRPEYVEQFLFRDEAPLFHRT